MRKRGVFKPGLKAINRAPKIILFRTRTVEWEGGEGMISRRKRRRRSSSCRRLSASVKGK